MTTNKLILLIAFSFSFLANIPRFIFLLVGDGDNGLLNLFEVSLADTLFRTFMLFGFCYVVLKFNLNWLDFLIQDIGFLHQLSAFCSSCSLGFGFLK